ncbi:trigger factor [Acidaminobacter sp. JC074]|uniref:trigger factor n=1 Tax=Acidaminobacter sp. JC074 TaxID=2530199 RepID=UPI001F0D8AE9|nr:trigger factor [Acidaminobacter sp. JC074]MCH4890396.1 trigger factor [Acidaminobacter sp. JC074]
MNYELLKKENNKVTISMKASVEDFNAAVKSAYTKERKRFNIPGFRKGKAPKSIIEKQYGEGVFYEEAINILLNEHYPKAIDELKLDVVDRPDVDIKEINMETGVELEAIVEVKPEFELDNYKGIEVEKVENPVTDEQLEEELKRVQDQNGRVITIEEGKVENGDTANINYAGFLGEEQFEGGTAEGHDLTIGSGQFIPGFEEELVGAEVGADVDVNVTFPEDYQAENLAGQPVVFKVKVNSISRKELPELDDEFAKDVSEFDTLDEYKADLKRIMVEQAENADKAAQRDKVIEAVSGLVDIEIPQGMIDMETDHMLRDFQMQLQYSGLQLDKYFELTGTTVEQLRAQMADDALTRVKTNLVIEKVKELENIEATEEDLNAEMEKYAEAQKQDIEQIKKMFEADNFEYIKNTIAIRKTVDFLVDNAKLK